MPDLLKHLVDPFGQGSWQDEGTIHVYWPRQRWSQDHYARLRQVLQQMEGREQPEADMLVQSSVPGLESAVGSVGQADSDRQTDCDQAELGVGGIAGTRH